MRNPLKLKYKIMPDSYCFFGTSINAQYAHDAHYMPTEYCLKMPSDSSKRIKLMIFQILVKNDNFFKFS